MKRCFPLAALMLLVVASTNIAQASENAAAEALADKMLAAIGGRDVWAQLRNTINGSQQNRAGEPTEVYAIITMDFERPRFRIETTAPGLHVARVINGKKSWRQRRNGKVEDVDDDFFKDEMRWYASHLYRTIHRIAARDPALSLKINDRGRLEVYEGSERLRWFELDASGEPYRFGSYDDGIGGLCGPWDFVQDGIHHPTWVSNAEGTWRASVQALSINAPLREHTFARPN
ncbi:MAG: hypothetical protein HKN50_13035 [Gammaproteobacteria bacterium]|nr:hypothetical protein [Gammaproteobacteria bacterium]